MKMRIRSRNFIPGKLGKRDELLYVIASLGYVKLQSIVSYDASFTQNYNVIKRAEVEGLLIRKRVQYVSDGRKRSFIIIRLTDYGLQYLARRVMKFDQQRQWVGYIDAWDDVRFPKYKIADQRMPRFINVTTSALCCMCAGGKVNKISLVDAVNVEDALDDEDENEDADETEIESDDYDDTVSGARTYEDIISEALKKYRDREQMFNGYISFGSRDFVFWNAYQIKNALRSQENRKDLRAGRYTGIAESPFISVLTYVGTRDGMSWSKWINDFDFRAYSGFLKNFGVYRTIKAGEVRAAMFVESPAILEDLFFDKKNKRDGEPFADGFKSFHIFPISGEGNQVFGQFMSSRFEEYEDDLAKLAIESGYYRKGTTGYSSLFPIEDLSGMPVMIGIYMDIVKLNRVNRVIEKNKLEFSILCYEWQVEYYKRICPNAKLNTMQ